MYRAGGPLVREGHAGLVLPQYEGIFDPGQRFPYRETEHWIDAIFDVNEHLFGRLPYGAEHLLTFPATASLAINGIRRNKGQSAENPPVRTVEVAADDLRTSPRRLLTLYKQNWDDRLVMLYREDAIFIGDSYNQSAGRTQIQRAVQDILGDLGYGSPNDFAANALPLHDYRNSHDIEWPPLPHPLEQYFSAPTTEVYGPEVVG